MELPLPGEVVDRRYRVEKTLGEGGFGTVYLATDLQSDSPVALKVLKPDPIVGYEPKVRARFEREARIVAQLGSPHTVALIDQGSTDSGLAYIAFEWVPGRDLNEVLAHRGRLGPDEVTHVLRQILDSLAEAHARGLLHRDLKPQNIRVFSDRNDPLRVKVLDFGLARSTNAGHPSVTSTGELVGTPRYMSPEQLVEGELTPASDIYSLGMLALELLCGREALQGNRWSDQLDRLRSKHVFTVPGLAEAGPQMTEVIDRMTARRGEDRFQSCAAVLHALDLIDGGGVYADDERADRPPPTEPAVAQPTTTQTLAMWWWVVGVCAVLILVLAIVVTRKDDERTPRVHPGAMSGPTQPKRDNPLGGSAEPPTVAAAVVEKADVGGQGCSAPFEGLGYLRDELSLSEEWLTYVPPGYGSQVAHPLLVFLHGTGQAPDAYLQYSDLRAHADQHGVVVVAPGDALLKPWGGRKAAARVTMIVEETERQLCIDSDRIFVVGHNRAGLTVEDLTCESWVAGAATFAYGSLRHPDGPFCKSARAVPYLLMYPTQSRFEPLEGGENCLRSQMFSVAEMTERWRVRNGCDSPSRVVFRAGENTCSESECRVPFQTCTVAGGRPWTDLPLRPKIPYDINDCDGPRGDFPLFARIFDFLLQAVPASDAR